MHSCPDDSIWRLFLLGKAPSSARTAPGLIKEYPGRDSGGAPDRWLLLLQPPFGVDGRHTPGARRRHRLAVAMVLNVPRGEHADDARTGMVVHSEVSLGSEVEGTSEDRGGGVVSDRDEQSADR